MGTRESTAAKVRWAEPGLPEPRAYGVQRDNGDLQAQEATQEEEERLEIREKGEHLGWMDVLVWMVKQVQLDLLARGGILGNRGILEEMVYMDQEGSRAPQGLSGPRALQGHLVKQLKMANLVLLARWVKMVYPGKMGGRGTKENQDLLEEMAETRRKETGVLLGLSDPLALPVLLDYLAALVLLDRWCTLKESKRHQSPARRGLQEPPACLGSLALWEPEATEARLATKAMLETQERTDHRANRGQPWMYKRLWPSWAFRCRI